MEADGLADKPSIVYGFDGSDEDIELREVVRSGYGEIGPSPGDVIARSRSQSDPDSGLPTGPLPCGDELASDDCGEDVPAFACNSCGSPTYVESTCGNPLCNRCWAAAIKDKTKRYCGKLEGLRRLLYASSDCNIIFNHVVASLPSFKTDSKNSKKTHDRALKALKTIFRETFGIESFASIYHEYRIKDEYRAESELDHGGAKGQGDMRWSDVLDKPADQRDKYLKREPHFHLFFTSRKGQFDYSATRHIENQSGWMLHRSEKRGDDNHVSVSNLDDLVRQVTYCLSHSMVNDWHADRHELTTRLKGDLHDIYAPDDAEDEIMSAFTKYSGTLLGVQFSQHSGVCEEEVADSDETALDDDEQHPLEDIYGDTSSAVPTDSGGNVAGDILDLGGGSSSGSGGNGTGDSSGDGEDADDLSEAIPEYARGPRCGGSVRPIREVAPRLDDDEWRAQAAYVDALRVAVDEWRSNDAPDVDELTPR